MARCSHANLKRGAAARELREIPDPVRAGLRRLGEEGVRSVGALDHELQVVVRPNELNICVWDSLDGARRGAVFAQ